LVRELGSVEKGQVRHCGSYFDQEIKETFQLASKSVVQKVSE
jgi:hypothetical protein